MDKRVEKIILFFSSAIGFLEEETNFVNFGTGYKEDRENVIDNMSKLFGNLIKYVPNREKDVSKLTKKIQAKKIYFDVVTHEDIKRRYKEPITISKKNRDIIAEHAINLTCKNCKRNKKRCALRTSLQECNVPAYHDEENKCPYDFS